MSAGDTSKGRLPAVAGKDAVSIIVATAPFGYILGVLFTVHFVGDETLAVWLTTVAASVLGVLFWAIRQSRPDSSGS